MYVNAPWARVGKGSHQYQVGSIVIVMVSLSLYPCLNAAQINTAYKWADAAGWIHTKNVHSPSAMAMLLSPVINKLDIWFDRRKFISDMTDFRATSTYICQETLGMFQGCHGHIQWWWIEKFMLNWVGYPCGACIHYLIKCVYGNVAHGTVCWLKPCWKDN